MLISHSLVFPHFEHFASLLLSNLENFRLGKHMHFYARWNFFEIIWHLEGIVEGIGGNLKYRDPTGRQET